MENKYIRPAYISELDNYTLYSLEKIPPCFYKDFCPMVYYEDGEKKINPFPDRRLKNENFVLMGNYIEKLLFLPEEERKTVEKYFSTIVYSLVLKNFSAGINFLTKYDIDFLEFYSLQEIDYKNQYQFPDVLYNVFSTFSDELRKKIDYKKLRDTRDMDEYYKFVLVTFLEKQLTNLKFKNYY
jgi:hypothetical protein